MGEGRKLPRAEVAGEEQHAFPAGFRLFVVFESVVDDDFLDVLERVAGKLADFGELASQRSEFSTQDAGALGIAFLGKSHGQIAHADFSQAGVKEIDHLSKGDGCGPGQGARQDSEDFDERPGCRVLKSLPHRGKRDGNTGGKWCQTTTSNYHERLRASARNRNAPAVTTR